MHVILKGRAPLPGGGMGAAGTVLDLPDAEVQPLLADGLAAAWPEPAPEPEAQPELALPESKPKAG